LNSQAQMNPGAVAEALEAGSAEFLKQSLERTANRGTCTKLYAASQTLLAAMRDERVIPALIEVCSNLLGCEQLAIVEIEHQTGTVHFLGEEGLSPEKRAALIRKEGILEARITTGRAWVPAKNGEGDSAFVPLGISALVPLWGDQRSMAAMVLFQLLPQRKGFDSEDLEVLQFLSLYAGPCLRPEHVGKNALLTGTTAARKPPSSGFDGCAGAAQITLPEVYLHPGQSHVASTPSTLKMILGSCTGVFLFDPTLGIGGATHFMLPTHGQGPPSPRYGDIAIVELLGKVRALGSNRRNLQAKVFGGASVLQALQNIQGSHVGRIGQKNVEIAVEILRRQRVEIVEKNVFGNRGRKVSMVSHTGEVKLDFLSNADGH
jgi:chemotaxis protein CheD